MPTFRFPVEAGHVMCFARALGDDDPIYRDAEHPRTVSRGGLAVPPTFVAAAAQFDPNWPYRPRPGQPWHGSGRDPGTPPPGTPSSGTASSGTPSSGTQAGGTSLHAEQHYTYHRGLRPGDVLTVESSAGATWDKHSARAGRLHFEEETTRFTDAAGELVVTARRVRVTTERPVEGARPGGRESAARPAATAGAALGAADPAEVRDLAVGDIRQQILVEGLTRTQIVMYAGASGDYNPLHSDEVYATKVAGYPSVIAHGQLTMGLTARLATAWLDNAALTAFGVRFSGQVWPGDTLTGTATVTEVGETDEAAGGRPTAKLDLVTTNQDGQPVVSGYAHVRGN